ncbi:sensor histidine kinase [Calothrix sp. PCC 6303]|uniref:sensor histidine kinase n=1 Tax=Calothrix sp. PCC 6303 TaxID=1170562 RepID=UPI0002A04DA5|nr:HAMP domain-containing sensor histidine kinase [Calothrix sp. PCC 6303]AFZ03518.1 histidine kinase [Calothrix sp. PCC 6303]
MYKWILPSLSEVIADNHISTAKCSSAKAEQQWRVSLAAVEKLLTSTLTTALSDTINALVIATPAPLFSQLRLTPNIEIVNLTAMPFNPLALMPWGVAGGVIPTNEFTPQEPVLPLLVADPLAKEQFCLVFTHHFQLVLVLAEDDNGEKTFTFSFEPEIVKQTWQVLAARVMMVNPDWFAQLADQVNVYAEIQPNYRILMYFSQLLLAELPEVEELKEVRGQKEQTELNNVKFNSTVMSVDTEKAVTANCQGTTHNSVEAGMSSRSDVELLQAFAHEVRTPLATILTITRLLLKQRDLPANVIKRLRMIEAECNEQIDRMELLFKAAELETSSAANFKSTQLTPMCLEQILQQSIPRWQQSASRRNLTLDVILPQHLPTVVSNPSMLDRALTGLIENFTRSLPAGSRIQVEVIPAGDQLKLQFLPLAESKDGATTASSPCTPPIRQALGQLLMFQPETGTISLNLNATKHLFQAIGGKLIVRQRPHIGDVMTIFFPLK